jgi:hypothetical protein
MKYHYNSLLHTPVSNEGSPYLQDAKEKRKTVYIKLPPKPYAPRHSSVAFRTPKLVPQ